MLACFAAHFHTLRISQTVKLNSADSYVTVCVSHDDELAAAAAGGGSASIIIIISSSSSEFIIMTDTHSDI